MEEEDTKCELMVAALNVLTETGYSEFSFSKVADESGKSKSLISYHFNSKKELFRELFNWMSEQTMLEKESEDEELEKILELLLPDSKENRRIQQALLEMGAASSEDDKIQEGYKDMHNSLESIIGESTEPRNSNITSEIILSLITGTVYRREILNEEIEIEDVRELLRDI